MEHIYLIGFMGTGKSTVGAALAKKTDRRLLDTDEMIIERDGRSISAIFETDGEAFFRRLESDVIREIASMDESCVVSCGGGAVLLEENVKAMKSSGRIVWLNASPAEILRRVSSDNKRPLLEGKKTVSDIETMMEKRRSVYEKAGDIVIETDHMSIGDIVDKIMHI